MRATRHQLSEILAEQSLSADFKPKSFSRALAKFLLHSDRVDELEPIIRDMIAFRAKNGIVEVTAISAHNLSTEDRTDIGLLVRQVYPEAALININESLDSSLIGGIKLEIVNQELDLTVRGRLNLLRQLTDPEVIKYE